MRFFCFVVLLTNTLISLLFVQLNVKGANLSKYCTSYVREVPPVLEVSYGLLVECFWASRKVTVVVVYLWYSTSLLQPSTYAAGFSMNTNFLGSFADINITYKCTLSWRNSTTLSKLFWYMRVYVLLAQMLLFLVESLVSRSKRIVSSLSFRRPKGTARPREWQSLVQMYERSS